MTNTMRTQEYRNAVLLIEGYRALVEHARFIVGESRRMDHPEFTKLEITSTGHVRVAWPEVSSGYYNDTSIQTQSLVIEPTLFIKPRAEIEAIWAEERRNKEELERERQSRSLALRIKTDENRERAEYARLRAKYEGEQS